MISLYLTKADVFTAISKSYPFVLTGMGILALFLCLCRGFSLCNAVIFAILMSISWFICLRTSCLYLSKGDIWVISPAVIMPVFWSLYICVLPLGFIYNSVNIESHVAAKCNLAMFWNSVGTIFLCFGLAGGSKNNLKLTDSKTPEFDAQGYSVLRLGGVIAFVLSLLYWTWQISEGLIVRGGHQNPEINKLNWVAEQLGYVSVFAVLGIFTFIAYANRAENKDTKTMKWFLLLASFELVMLVIKLQYRWIGIALFMLSISHLIYYGRLNRLVVIMIICIVFMSSPVVNTLRSRDHYAQGEGIEYIQDLIVNQIPNAFMDTYLSRNQVSRKNEFDRGSDTFLFTMDVLEAIPTKVRHYWGDLVLQDIKLNVPYFMWPSKFDKGPLLEPETTLNIDVNGSDNDTGISPIILLWGDGGALFVIIGMFGFGYFYSCIFKFMLKTFESGLGPFVYSYSILSFMQLEVDWYMATAFFIKLSVLVFLIWLLIDLVLRMVHFKI